MPRKSKTVTGAERRTADRVVWRFVAYGERFGVDGAKMPVEMPQYVRWTINAWDGPRGQVLGCLNRLRAEKNFIWLQGAVVELLTAATNIDPQYQGYLVTSRMEPASAAEVGSMLRVDGRKALAALTVLTRAGFLEQVPWPYADFDGPIVDSQCLRLLQNVAEASQKPARNRGRKGRKQPKNEDDPLIRGIGTKEKGETAAQNNSEGAWPPQEQTPPCDGGKHAALRATVKTPTATPSTSSANLDAGAGPSADGRYACPSSPAPIGQIVRMTRYRYSLAAWAFADSVLMASGYREPDPAAKECEKAHWAKAWDTAVSAFGAEVTEQIKRKILGEAATLRQAGRPKDNCEAFLMAAWNNDVRDLRRRRKSSSA